MIALFCSVSFLSIAAMIASIVFTLSPETILLCLSASCASVATAEATASSAAFDFGLISFFSSAENSSASFVPVCAWAWFGLASVIDVLLSLRLRLLGVRRGREGLQQRGVGQRLAQDRFRLVLAVEVGLQVVELRAGLEELAQRADLLRDGRRREVVHALERELDAQIALAGERVGHLERGARLHRLQPIVEVVDVDLEQ